MMQLVNNFSSYTEETPIDKTPNDKTSIDKTPIDKTPIDKTPNDKTPNDKTPNNKTPIDKTPIDKTNKETFATKCLLTFYAIQKMFWKYCIVYMYIFGFVNPMKAVFRKSPSYVLQSKITNFQI